MRNIFSQHAIFCPKQQIARTLRFPKTSLLCNNFQDVFYNIAGYPSACLAGLFYKCRAKIARPQLHTRACGLPQLVKFKIKPVSAISHVSALCSSRRRRRLRSQTVPRFHACVRYVRPQRLRQVMPPFSYTLQQRPETAFHTSSCLFMPVMRP